MPDVFAERQNLSIGIRRKDGQEKQFDRGGSLQGRRRVGRRKDARFILKPQPSKMTMDSSNTRIFTITDHTGMAAAGFMGDSRKIAAQARKEVSSYKKLFCTEIPAKILNDRVAGYVHSFTLKWDMRPFGASVLMASHTEDGGPQLFLIDPSGATHVLFEKLAIFRERHREKFGRGQNRAQQTRLRGENLQRSSEFAL
ncbi:Proteasome subunit alpha type-3 [Bonamia ostreae]|uniref:Proteasome subunit alpha type-3 n=1 Tax=Bonamia ostreae TaxID=126728 RepID=A0ABV2AJL2_9EUKA